MRISRSLPLALAILGIACGSDNSLSTGSGGTSSRGGSGGSLPSSTGGVAGASTGAQAGGRGGNGGAQTTQTASGGSTSTSSAPVTGGATASGGRTEKGGSTGSGGASATGGAGGRDAGADTATGTGGAGQGGSTGTTGVDGGGPSGAKPSAGCGKTPTLLKSTPPPNTKMNYNKIGSRQYLLWYPDNYDNNKPHRLIFNYHWLSGSASQVFDCKTEGITCRTTQSPFYGLLNQSLADDNATIFIAPDGLNAGWANSNGQDVTFTDDMLKAVSNDLCIDMSRIFANGFSYGGGMSYAIACARADVFRGVAVYAGGTLSGCSGGSKPIAYMGVHGLDDGTLNISGGRSMRDRFVKNNGCTSMNPPEPAKGSGTHTCTSYEGCTAGYPVRWCAFAGSFGHDPSPMDPGQKTTWTPAEVWKFFKQF